MEEAFICEQATVDDCYIEFELDDLYLMTGIEIYSAMGSECFPKVLNLEYSVIIIILGEGFFFFAKVNFTFKAGASGPFDLFFDFHPSRKTSEM